MNNDIRTDDELMSEVNSGNEEALGSLIDRYSAYVYTIVSNVTRGKLTSQDAEEITSEAFYRLWQNASSVHSGKVKAFLARIARNRAIDAVRRSKSVLPLTDTVSVHYDGPENEAVKLAEYAALKRAVDTLPEPDRTLFLGRYYLARSSRELAKEMGLSLNTVKTKLRRGREKLRRELENGGYYENQEDI